MEQKKPSCPFLARANTIDDSTVVLVLSFRRNELRSGCLPTKPFGVAGGRGGLALLSKYHHP